MPLFCVLPCFLKAQNFSQNLPAAPSGFSHPTAPIAGPLDSVGGGDLLGISEDLGLEGLIRGFSVQASLSGVYDSNVTQGQYNSVPSGAVGEEDSSAFIIGLGGTLSYNGGGSEWTYGASYRFGYDQYIGDRSDMSGLNQQTSDIFLTHAVGKLRLNARAGMSINDGANRFYGEVVKETAYNFGLTGHYDLSEKTSLNSSLTYSFTESDSADNADTSSFDFNFGASWKFSPLTRIGPGIRYSVRTGDDEGDRTTIGPTINLNYELSTKVSFNSSVGLAFVSYDDGRSPDDPDVTASVGLTYRASSFWGLTASLHRDTQSDPSRAGSYDQVTSINTGYYRNIRRAVAQVGVGYEISESESDGSSSSTGGRGDRNYLTLNCSLSMPLFANAVTGSVFARYKDQEGDSDEDTWDGYQLGFSLSHQF